jgi:2-oxoglutarate ferredoxin oxidoreductase subunit beta
MWCVSAKNGNIDPTFDACALAIGAGASFVARETMLDPKKLEKILVKGFQHKGFSFFDIMSNCHINLGRKNKMASAMENLEWIDSITLPKKKWDELPEEEKLNKFPTGILRQVEQPEYCELYDEVIAAAQGKRNKITQDDFEKKI